MTVTGAFIVNVEAAIYREGKWLIISRSLEEEHAPGMLALVGGKVEADVFGPDVLEQTLKREAFEEVGLVIEDPVRYVFSTSFATDDGVPVVDVIFLCCKARGDAAAKSPAEVGELHWMTTEEVLAHPEAPEWTKASVWRAEVLRREMES